MNNIQNVYNILLELKSIRTNESNRYRRVRTLCNQFEVLRHAIIKVLGDGFDEIDEEEIDEEAEERWAAELAKKFGIEFSYELAGELGEIISDLFCDYSQRLEYYAPLETGTKEKPTGLYGDEKLEKTLDEFFLELNEAGIKELLASYDLESPI